MKCHKRPNVSITITFREFLKVDNFNSEHAVTIQVMTYEFAHYSYSWRTYYLTGTKDLTVPKSTSQKWRPISSSSQQHVMHSWRHTNFCPQKIQILMESLMIRISALFGTVVFFEMALQPWTIKTPSAPYKRLFYRTYISLDASTQICVCRCSYTNILEYIFYYWPGHCMALYICSNETLLCTIVNDYSVLFGSHQKKHTTQCNSSTCATHFLLNLSVPLPSSFHYLIVPYPASPLAPFLIPPFSPPALEYPPPCAHAQQG